MVSRAPRRRAQIADDFGLTRSQLRVIERRVKEARDPTRYLVVSRLGPRFLLYYNVTDNDFVMNRPAGGTLFKRRDMAVAAARLLRSGLHVVRCTTRIRKGVRVPVLPKRWAPKQRRATRRRR
jgi:hypothetical protein